MRTHVHLVSTFGPNAVLQPSIQLAALKAHLERAGVADVACSTHSVFAAVPWRAWPEHAEEHTRRVAEFGEYPFSLLCLTDLEPERLRDAGVTEQELLRRVQDRAEFRHVRDPLDWEDLEALRRAHRADLEARFSGGLDENALHLWGFTTDYSQVFSSAYFIRHVRRAFPHHRFRVVLGGAAASLPDTARAMAAMKVDALCVEGEGELKLEQMCRNLSALPPDADDATVDAALLSAGPGVRRLDGEHRAWAVEGLTQQVREVSTLPLPDFSGFFLEMDALASQGATGLRNAPHFSMPMEGSRGCFATCAFCSNPRSWSGYRKMAGAEVLQRTVDLFGRHPFSSVTFMDVVCDTWASQFAQGLLETGTTLPSVMCFRAHHPEAFFTRMALSGVVHVQVGVEALSPPLLARMDKGTRVVQNVLAQKYLAELRVTQWNNLITHYPDSTLADVDETRRVLLLTPHLGAFGLSPLSLRAGSPLHDRALREGLTLAREWAPTDVRFPQALEVFDDTGVQRAAPKGWLQDSVREAWSRFEDWYDAFAHEHVDATCDVLALPGGRMKVVDARLGVERVWMLEGDDAQVLEACHSGPTVEKMMEKLRMPRGRVEDSVGRLLDKRLLLLTEDALVALPLRSRDVLVRNHHRQERALPTEPRLRVMVR